jgi:hypothetical protein
VTVAHEDDLAGAELDFIEMEGRRGSWMRLMGLVVITLTVVASVLTWQVTLRNERIDDLEQVVDGLEADVREVKASSARIQEIAESFVRDPAAQAAQAEAYRELIRKIDAIYGATVPEEQQQQGG